MPWKDVEKKLAWMREEYRRRRNAFFSGRVCVDCGTTENLELDHKDRTKKVSHRVWTWAEKRMKRELAKCQALCEDCHELKSSKESAELNSRSLTHGSAGYRRNCRCNVCRAGYSQKRKEKYLRTGT